MFCPNCGTDNPNSAVFCGSCGCALPRVQKEVQPSVQYCPKCGQKIDSGAAFCGNCGLSLGTAPQPLPTPAPVQPASKLNVVNKKIAMVAVAAVLVVIALSFLGNLLGGKSGRGTANDVAQTLEEPLNNVYASGLDDESLNTFAETLVDELPSEVVDTELQKSGMTKDEAVGMVASQMSSSMGSMSSLKSYLDKMQIETSIKLTDELDSDAIDDINKKLEEYGLYDSVTEGYKIGADVTVTALEDLPALSKGETKTNSVSNLGAEAIKVDGRWYLWSPQLNW